MRRSDQPQPDIRLETPADLEIAVEFQHRVDLGGEHLDLRHALAQLHRPRQEAGAAIITDDEFPQIAESQRRGDVQADRETRDQAHWVDRDNLEAEIAALDRLAVELRHPARRNEELHPIRQPALDPYGQCAGPVLVVEGAEAKVDIVAMIGLDRLEDAVEDLRRQVLHLRRLDHGDLRFLDVRLHGRRRLGPVRRGGLRAGAWNGKRLIRLRRLERRNRARYAATGDGHPSPRSADT